MNRKLCAIVLAVLVLLTVSVSSLAEGTLGATVVMRVSHMTQNAIVNAGEDFSMDISVEGADPAEYRWYYNDAQIEGATRPVYNIVNAAVEDSGVYRMDALNETGDLLVSTEICVRVPDTTIPKAGDNSVSPVWVLTLMGVAALVLTGTAMSRRRA